MENVEKLLNGEERREILIQDAKDLVELGWNFENDYELFSPDSPLPNPDQTFSTYQEYIENSEVYLIVERDGSTKYLSAPKGGDWSQADAFIPTGDDEQTIKDLIKLGC